MLGGMIAGVMYQVAFIKLKPRALNILSSTEWKS